jgi:hypothetical protein
MEVAEELNRVVAAREREFGIAGFHLDDPETGRAGKTLGVDGLGKVRRIKFRRIERIARQPGIRTGNCSMPRTKLE